MRGNECQTEKPQNPKVTVLMIVYNREQCLPPAIESVLNQTFKDFELLIIDDGSTDNSVEIIKKYHDPRIRLLQNEKNRGILFTRNKGVDEARGDYIAVLDSDDIALRTKLEKQVKFLEANSDIGMTASWVRIIDSSGTYTKGRGICRAKPEEIPVELIFHNVFTHSSVMFRREIIQEYKYSTEFSVAEDYDLFVRITEKHKSWHIPKVLTLYRTHSENISDQKRLLMNQCVEKIVGRQLGKLGITYTDEELKLHIALGEYRFSKDVYFIDAAEKWLKKLRQSNELSREYDSKVFNKIIGNYWFMVLYAASAKGLWAFKRLYTSDLAMLYKPNSSPRDILKYLFFIGKCLLKK